MAVHGDKAIAYVCNGSTVEGWMRGKVDGDKLVLTGKNQTHLTASYHTGKVTGDVEAHGTDYSFSVPTVSKSSSKSSGLYQATAVVQGKTIKAGWIVLGDGTQIGSLEIGRIGRESRDGAEARRGDDDRADRQRRPARRPGQRRHRQRILTSPYFRSPRRRS